MSSLETRCSVCKSSIEGIPRVFSCCDKIHCEGCDKTGARDSCVLCGDKNCQSLIGESLEQVFLTGREPEKWDEIDEMAEWTAVLTLLPGETRIQERAWPTEITIPEGPRVLISLRPLEGEGVRMTVSLKMRIRDFRQSIGAALDIDHEKIRLVHKGLPLLDDKTFGESCVGEGSTVVLVLQMRGS